MEHSRTHANSLPTIFVTGGAGYIGSHFLELWLRSGKDYFEPHKIVVLDNFSNGHLEIIEIINQEFIRNYEPLITIEKVDLCNMDQLRVIFKKYKPLAVIHFAGKISVSESITNPEFYYKNNIEGSENLLLAMQENDCKNIVFSSTAAVYGNIDDSGLITEDFPLEPINPYGYSKLKIEQSIAEAHQEWGLKAVIFRYFNAAGAASSGLIGEWHEPETHLIPLIIESVLNQKSELKIYGNDYPTRDGSCIRDYIHVSDLGMAHILGLKKLIENSTNVFETYNLGTQNGTSVLEIIAAVKKVTKKTILGKVCDRRLGDAPLLVASNMKARTELGWQPINSDIENIIKTAYLWHQNLLRLKENL